GGCFIHGRTRSGWRWVAWILTTDRDTSLSTAGCAPARWWDAANAARSAAADMSLRMDGASKVTRGGDLPRGCAGAARVHVSLSARRLRGNRSAATRSRPRPAAPAGDENTSRPVEH